VLIGSGLGGITGILLGVPLFAFGYRMVKEKLEEREKEKEMLPPGNSDPPEMKEPGGDQKKIPDKWKKTIRA
jgi:hypothetical protein